MKHRTRQLQTAPIRQSGFVSLDYAIVGTTLFVIALAVALGAGANSLLTQFGL